MTAQSELKLYKTQPHDCSYLADQQSTTLFVDPDAELDPYMYSRLAEQGFRRSGNHVYKPYCEQCHACIPSRVPVHSFHKRRQQRKIWNRNSDLRVVIRDKTDHSDDTEIYHLYERYINERHSDGDMYPASREQFDSFLTHEWGITRFYCFYQQSQLLAVAVADVMDNGLAAIYCFYDPDQDRRSLGVYSILWQIEEAKRLGLETVYLGYWIKQCRKMSYKTDYRPLELLIKGQWLTLK